MLCVSSRSPVAKFPVRTLESRIANTGPVFARTVAADPGRAVSNIGRKVDLEFHLSTPGLGARWTESTGDVGQNLKTLRAHISKKNGGGGSLKAVLLFVFVKFSIRNTHWN